MEVEFSKRENIPKQRREVEVFGQVEVAVSGKVKVVVSRQVEVAISGKFKVAVAIAVDEEVKATGRRSYSKRKF